MQIKESILNRHQTNLGTIAAFSILSLFLSLACAHKPVSTPHEKKVAAVEGARDIKLQSGSVQYRVLAHSEKVAPLLKGQYSRSDLDQLENLLRSKLSIDLTERGLVKAANRELETEKDSTNYDAIWLRDSLWVYLGLKHAQPTKAQTVLSRMLDYLSSKNQLARMDRLISNPSLLKAKDGNMQVIHIRFNGSSPDFDDVYENGKPQNWNHKQNDALGLFYDLTLRELQSGEMSFANLSPNQWRLLTGLPCYFDAVKFYEMEDAGPWEEIDRVNTSSIALVTSGLENLSGQIQNNSNFAKEFLRQAGKVGFARCASRETLSKLINKGYDRIHRQIAAGGESPLYPLGSPKYRRADAALFNALYPARLSQLSEAERSAILAINQPLIGRVGIKRYLFDSYQSGNFWLPEPVASGAANTETDAHTDDTSSNESFALRGAKFIADTEAQWFFDSWLSLIYGQLYQSNKKKIYLDLEVQHLNRALAQLTGGEGSNRVLGADGKPVPSLIPPESYNQLVEGSMQRFVPSPIAPLNWAKASLMLALQQLRYHLNDSPK